MQQIRVLKGSSDSTNPVSLFIQKITETTVFVIDTGNSLKYFNRKTSRRIRSNQSVDTCNMKKVDDFLKSINQETWDGGWKPGEHPSLSSFKWRRDEWLKSQGVEIIDI